MSADSHPASGVDLERLRTLAAKATPGPWEASSANLIGRLWNDEWRQLAVTNNHDGWSSDEARDNAAFISACDPQTIIALLDRVAEQDARIDRLLDCIEMIRRVLAKEGGVDLTTEQMTDAINSAIHLSTTKEQAKT